MWARYVVDRDPDTRRQLILQYMGLVRAVAARMSVDLPSSVERDDLTSYGTFGLIDAIDRFDPGRGVKFETFAALRIRGNIIDELRSADWVPRSVRSKARMVERARSDLVLRIGRNPSEAELAEYLEMTPEELAALRSASAAPMLTTLDVHDDDERPDVDLSVQDIGADPAGLHHAAEVLDVLSEAVSTLDERSRLVVTLYYIEGMTLAEIGAVLGVTVSRVCQLQGKLLQSLRSVLEPGMAELA